MARCATARAWDSLYVLSSAACTEGGSSGEVVQEPAVWTLAEQPSVEIGVVEGPPEYERHNATSSVVLPSGRIVVANTGTQEVRFYDSEGKFVARSGGRGTGPGEFRWLMRVYGVGPDSVMAFDGAGSRFSVFDDAGTFARTLPMEPIDSVFPMEVWLYRRFWVDGGRDFEARRIVRRALDNVPVPAAGPGYRFVRVDSDDNPWVRRPADGSAVSQWDVFDHDGRAIATVQTPARLDLHQIGSDFILGRWRDDDDVNSIRMYGSAC